MIYAPVIIPTLNRFEHFKNCIESLSKCTWAEYTEVYIGLDYPAKESHWDGYRKIEKYLKDCDNLNFKKIHVIKRSHNYGIGLNGNFADLRKTVFLTNDRIICTEDDNIFSPNFLVYMNKGLELFKDDKSILAINGYRHYYNMKFGGNTYFRQNVDFSAWGYGTWADRVESWSKVSSKYFRYRFAVSTFLKVLKNGKNRAAQFLAYCTARKPIVITDNLLSVYAAINDYNVIMPSVSLVRNMGVDGSGENFKDVSKELKNVHLSQIISLEKDFFYKGNGWEYYEENREIFKDSSYGKISTLRFICEILKFFIKRFVFIFD